MAYLKNKKNILVDEITIDNFSSALDRRERQLNNNIFLLTLSVFCVIGIVVILRITYFGIIRNEFYSARADANVNKVTIIPARRGLILDRHGNPIVQNITIFSLRLRPSELIKYNEEQAVRLLLENIGIGETDFNRILNVETLNKSDEIIIKREISTSDAIIVKASSLKSLYVIETPARKFNSAFAHVVGYVGPPSREEIRTLNLTSVDVIGETNIESIYDSKLRGINGRLIEPRNAFGEVLEKSIVQEAKQGESLITTIDAGLQEYFYTRLSEALDGAGPGGVGIAINPLNGDVLSLISLPSFNSSNIAEKLNDPKRPLFNRAVMGVYSPASTIKLIVSVAALAEEIITDREMVFSAGYLSVPNRFNPDNPTIFRDWRPHGWVDIYSAIARSSNIFFYAVGGGLLHNEHLFMGNSNIRNGLGISRLNKYFSLFNLGQKTGISLSAEADGSLPSPENKASRIGRPWTTGDTYNVSIGQGDLLLTPINLLNSVTPFVNGGFIYRPNLILEEPSNKIADLTHLKSELNKVHEGMKDAVREPYGTAFILNQLPFEVSGKTGTAQVPGGRINAFFVGCGPLQKETENHVPICILVLIENAREGALNTIPVVRDVFRWYYDNRINITE